MNQEITEIRGYGAQEFPAKTFLAMRPIAAVHGNQKSPGR